MAIVVNPTPIDVTSSEKDTIKSYQVDLMVTATEGDFLAPDNIYEHIDTLFALQIGATYPPFPFDDPNVTMQLRTRDVRSLATSKEGVCYRALRLVYEQQVTSLQANKNQSRPPAYEDQDDSNGDPIGWEPEVLFDQEQKEYTPPRMRFAGYYDATAAGADPIAFDPMILSAVANKSCAITKGAYAPVVNSACDPIVNPIQLVRYRQRITVINRVDNASNHTIESEMKLSNFTNDRALRLQMVKQHINWQFPPGTLAFLTLKPVVRRVTWNDGTDNERVYWEKRYEFLYDPLGHYWDIANLGHRKTPIQGEAKDASNGKVLTNGQFAAIPDGGIVPVPIADAKDKNNDPQILDVDGRPDPTGVGVMRYERVRADFLNTDSTSGAPSINIPGLSVV